IDVYCPSSDLAVGADMTCTAASPYVVTAADAEAGHVHNVATTSGTTPGGDTPGDESETDTPVEPTPKVPGVSLEKMAELSRDINGNTKADEADEISFSFVVTNTGAVTLSDVSVSDPMLAELGIDVYCPSSDLAVGADMTCAAATPYIVTAADAEAGHVHNVAAVSGTTPDGDTPTDTSTTDTPVEPTPKVPGVSLEKSAELTKDANGNGAADEGDEITFSFLVTNTGETELSDVSVSDPMLSNLRIDVVCPSSDLAVGTDMTCTAASPYVVTAEDAKAGHVVNVAAVSGTTPDGDTPTDTSTTDTPVKPTPKPPLPSPEMPETGATGAELGGMAALLLLAGGGFFALGYGSRRRAGSR
ncbi:MAG: hypothetical protein Q4P36_01370, partial [Bowdeniella nasicola]|nr:hypothetical protein [Bowdeniella nasicola]